MKIDNALQNTSFSPAVSSASVENTPATAGSSGTPFASLLEQAKGRAVRMGQKNVVKIYWLKLMTEEDRMSIDDFMMNKASEKLDLAHKFHSLGVSLKSPPVC